MFDDLQKRLSSAFKKFRVSGVLTEANMREGLREVRTALLEADVHFDVVQEFMARINAEAAGMELVKSIRPEQQIVKVVHDELIDLMGPVDPSIRFEKAGTTVLMLCGLQGAGKTTTCGKLAKLLQSQGRKPMLVAADLQRPAAIEQLKVIGSQIGVPVHSQADSNPVAVCQQALVEANRAGCDTLILDTAGRLHVDEMPMDELKQIDRVARPDHVYFVCDAMTGQDAVNSAKAFNEALDLNGVILTKMDGDARGGAALSIKEVAKVPIKFIGVGEKLDRLEEFRPEGMAQRILGQGDIMSLIEKVSQVQAQISQEELAAQQKKLQEGDFTLDDFRKQFEQLKKMGPMKDVLGKMPGMAEMIPEDEDPETAFRRIQGMIDSMTKQERRNPDVIDIGRRRRIAAGSGTEPHEVKQFIGQFEQVRTLMRQMAKMSIWERIRMVTGLGKAGAFQPGARLVKKGDTGHRKSPKERAKDRKKKKKR
jgi:signal recognition particle subunit SRP54